MKDEKYQSRLKKLEDDLNQLSDDLKNPKAK